MDELERVIGQGWADRYPERFAPDRARSYTGVVACPVCGHPTTSCVADHDEQESAP